MLIKTAYQLKLYLRIAGMKIWHDIWKQHDGGDLSNIDHATSFNQLLLEFLGEVSRNYRDLAS